MLALIGDLAVDITPVPLDTDVQYGITTRRNHVEVWAGARKIEHGVTFFVMSDGGHVKVDPRSGQYEVAKGEQGVIRAVFAGQHLDVKVFG